MSKELKGPGEKKLFEEVYDVNPPYAYVGIERINEEVRYVVIEPFLTEREKEIIEKIKEILLTESHIDIEKLKDRKIAEEFLKKEIHRIVKSYKFKLNEEQVDKLSYYIFRDSLGYGKIDVLVRDPNVEDISVIGVNIPVYVWHRNYENISTNVVLNEGELRALISKLSYRAGKQISVSKPILDGFLPEGYRIHIVLDEVSLRGGSFTIRKFSRTPYTVVDLIKFGTLSPKLAAYLWSLIENFRSLMICGGTAAGKTTLLNAISMFIHPDAKVVTIEEARELRLPHENWVPLVTRPAMEGLEEITLFDLLKSALRQRPDYVIVGEIRGEEAYTFFQAIATGHGGLCSMHSESGEAAIKRLITRPMNVPLLLIPMISTIVLIAKVKIGGKIARRVIDVKEIRGVDVSTGDVHLNPVFKWVKDKDSFSFSERSYVLEKISEISLRSPDEVIDDLNDKALILKWMLKKDLHDYDQIANVVREYYRNKTGLLDKVRMEAAIYGIK